MNIIIDRKSNMDALRTISAFLIVLLHVSADYWAAADLNSYKFIVMTFYNGLCRSAVPLFLMISGMFMIPKCTDGKYLSGKILKLIGCFFLWSFFYAAQGLAIKYIRKGSISEQDFHSGVNEFLFGHYHQWFLLMLAGIYLILPFIKKICSDKKTLIYFILLWLVSNIILPLLPISGFTDLFQLHFTIGYVGYFVIGYYIAQYGIEKKYRACLYLAGIIAFIYTVSATIFVSRNTGSHVQIYFGGFTWNVFLMTISIFVFFQYKKEKDNLIRKVFIKLSGTSLIVYMLHPFFNEKIGILEYNPCWTVPVISILIYGVCVILAIIFLKILSLLHMRGSQSY